MPASPQRRLLVFVAAVLVSAPVQGLFGSGQLPTYGPAQSQVQGVNQSNVSATADFNCDGLMDVVVAGWGGSATTNTVGILLANGHGGFVDGTSQVIVGAPPLVQNPHKVVLADFNGD